MAWFDVLEMEHDNLREAIRWSFEGGEQGMAGRLCGAMGWFWFVRGLLGEGTRWLDTALSVGSWRPVRACLYQDPYVGWRSKAVAWRLCPG